MKLREKRREPFFGEAVDRELLGPGFKPALEGFEELGDLPPDLAELQTLNASPTVDVERKAPQHPDAVEKGITLPLGFIPHRGENRVKRLAGVKTWAASPEQVKAAEGGPALATRREMYEQRVKHQRGKLDPVLRRLQRERLKTK